MSPQKKNLMGDYSRTPEEDEAAIWCLHNNICITPRQSAWRQPSWFVDIETGKYPNRKKIGTSPESYRPGVIWQKICEYQKYYYGKYKNKV